MNLNEDAFEFEKALARNRNYLRGICPRIDEFRIRALTLLSLQSPAEFLRVVGNLRDW